MKNLIYLLLLLSFTSCKVLQSEDFVGSYETIHVYDVQDVIVIFPNNKFQYKWYAGLAGNGGTSGNWYIKRNNLYLTSYEEEEPIHVLITKQPQKPNFKIYEFIIKDDNDEIKGCSCIVKYKGKIIGSQISNENGICKFLDIKIDELQLFFAGKRDFNIKNNFEFGTYDLFLEDKKIFIAVFNNEKVKLKKESLIIKNKLFFKSNF